MNTNTYLLTGICYLTHVRINTTTEPSFKTNPQRTKARFNHVFKFKNQ